MIGPVSEVGKTMLSSLQGAMAKGMPVDQAIQYVKSQAATGVAPLVDLYALLKQFERLKQPPAQPLMGGNLKQQLDNIESTAVRSPGGITGQPMPAAPASPMGGLASLDAGRMENPQGFNMGGIVAFAEGGQPEKPKSITPELYTSPKLPTSLEDLARQAAAEEAALKTPEGRAAFLAQRDAEMKEAGLGKYAKSIELRDKMAEDAAKRAELLPGEEAALNEQEYWDAVAATDQPDLISAMAKAKAGTTARKRASIQRVNAAKDKAAEERALRQEAREALARGDVEAFKAKKEAAETLKKTSVKDYVTEVEADKDAKLAAQRAQDLARVNKGESDVILGQLRRTPETINGQPNPEFARLTRLYNIAKGAGKSTSGRDYQTVKSQWTQAGKVLKTAQENYNYDDSEENKAALQEAQTLYDYWNRQFLDFGGVEGMPSEFGGSTELPAGFQLDK
jgi:hypothetical protein